MRNCKLYLGGNDKEIERVLTALFSRGFVIGNTARVKTMESIRSQEYFGYSPKYWMWVITGLDCECKMSLNLYTTDCFNDMSSTKLEDFLEWFDKQYRRNHYGK